MKLKTNIATNWNQLTDQQLAKISLLLVKDLAPKKFDAKVFAILVKLRWFQIRKQIKVQRVFNNYTFKDLKKQYNYIYETCTRTVFIKLKKFTAPGDRLNNISIEEFAVAENLFKLFWQTKEFKYLQFLAAVLYVKTPYPDRPTFNKHNLNKASKAFKRVRKRKLLAVAFCYMGAKNYITKKYPLTFPAPVEGAIGGQDKGFNPVIIQMSGGKFGTHTETKTTNLYTFLDEYEENLKQIQNANNNRSEH
jgi:hypothetical protein